MVFQNNAQGDGAGGDAMGAAIALVHNDKIAFKLCVRYNGRFRFGRVQSYCLIIDQNNDLTVAGKLLFFARIDKNFAILWEN